MNDTLKFKKPGTYKTFTDKRSLEGIFIGCSSREISAILPYITLSPIIEGKVPGSVSYDIPIEELPGLITALQTTYEQIKPQNSTTGNPDPDSPCDSYT